MYEGQNASYVNNRQEIFTRSRKRSRSRRGVEARLVEEWESSGSTSIYGSRRVIRWKPVEASGSPAEARQKRKRWRKLGHCSGQKSGTRRSPYIMDEIGTAEDIGGGGNVFKIRTHIPWISQNTLVSQLPLPIAISF